MTRGRGATSNHWELTNCHIKLNIATYNIQSLSSDDRLYELETELNKIKWDIVGLCEVRRPGEELMTLQSGNTLYYREGPRPGVGGIGFIVNKNLKNAVIEINSISDRVAYLKLKLSSMYELAVIQIYAPTTDHTDDEVEEFYDDVSSVIDKVKTHYTIVMGDFNARLGARMSVHETGLGQYGLGHRNTRGQRLLNFLHQKNMFAMNTFFAKKPQYKWTWKHPNGIHKNEYDYIATDRKDIVQDVTVLNRFSTGSDHRIVRASLSFNIKKERRKLVTKKFTPNEVKMVTIRSNMEEYKHNLNVAICIKESEQMSIESMNDHIVKGLNSALEAVSPPTSKQKTPQKLSSAQ